MSLENYSKEQLKEMSMIEMAYELLKNTKQTLSFHDIVDQISKASDLSSEQVRSRLAQFYTDLNIDGRFISLGENKWGLRVWYPVDTVEEEQVHAAKPKKKKAKKVLDEELDDYEELDDTDFDDPEDFVEDDILDEEDDDSFDDIDEEEEDFDIADDEAIDEDLEEDIDEDLDDDLEESLEALEEEELAEDEDEDEEM
ncbi:DNA-directed RNA polymerase subunit delta [Bacillus sp. FJAT-18017]|nr:DNA-directed RNA polymerase subunit delta [Bacillus sp. FJAT-18017]ALC92611.1 DNA-directed RNA polymerase subunit delta [Bacillus sp. FJAT-18017]